MHCGISTACFYPLDTIKALRRVAALGAPVTELFINSPSEVEEPYITRLAAEVAACGVRVASVHPYSSAMDAFFFSSDYAARLQDGIDLYRRQFEACQRLGADKLVFHGGRKAPLIKRVKAFPVARYAEHFQRLAAAGREYGVRLCQENVAYCMMATPEDVRQLKRLLGADAAFVLDTKQAHRRGEDPLAYLDAMGDGLFQVHLSSYSAAEECLPPGQGDFDTAGFVHRLEGRGYAGELIIEVYSDSYRREEELAEAMRYLERLLETGGDAR